PGPPPQYLTDEMTRLRSNPMQFTLRFLQDIYHQFNRLLFHNVQSLHKHFMDVICDNSYMESDVLCFVEPWTLEDDIYDMPAFSIVRRQNCGCPRNSEGSFLASK